MNISDQDVTRMFNLYQLNMHLIKLFNVHIEILITINTF